MKAIQKINLVLLILISLGAGVAKVMQLPDEVKYFMDSGLGLNALLVLGGAQLLGAILLVFQNTRRYGAGIMIATFLVSTTIIFMNAQITFGIFSLLPVLMAGFVIWGRDTA
jgi:hypothetical protein